MSQPKRIDFLFFDAGGGHRSAALALKEVVEEQYPDWEVRLLNLQEVLDSLDVFRKVTGMRLQDIYNLVLKNGWTLGSVYWLRMMHLVIRIYHRSQVRLLTQMWRERKPDLVVSLIPNFNRAIFESLQRAIPGTDLVTVLTDLADYPPHFWIEKQQQYFVCGTDRAMQQAISMGHPPSRVFRVSGMILRPAFYRTVPISRSEERQKLGLAAGLPTGLVLFGGQGSEVMREIAEKLGNCSIDLQLIVICGRNTKLKARLEQLRTRHRIHVEGFTERIPELMSLADFFIGKPGPGSISEAIHMGLPAIVERNAWTLPQERYNAEWLKENGLGIVLKDFRRIDAAVRQLLQGENLEAMRRRASQCKNRAVFEIAGILGRILSKLEESHQRQ